MPLEISRDRHPRLFIRFGIEAWDLKAPQRVNARPT